MIRYFRTSPNQEILDQLACKLFETHRVPYLQYRHPNQILRRMYSCRSWYPPNGVNKTKYLCDNTRISKTICTNNSKNLINENRNKNENN